VSPPLAPRNQAGPGRPVPSVWRCIVVDDDDVSMLVAVGLAVPTLLAALVGTVRGARWEWFDAVKCVALIAAGVALAWWRIASIRGAFARGSEIRARITHLQRVDYTKEQRRFGFHGRPTTVLHVVYAIGGEEGAADYSLNDGDIARLRLSIGAEVVLVAGAGLPAPLLRDLYLRP